MPNEERLTVAVTNAQNIDFNANGSAVLVQLSSDGYAGAVDFQTTVDGVTFYNIPYVPRLKPGALPITDQIIPSQIASPSLYYLQGPLSQVRIACSGRSAGTLTVVYRTIPGVSLDRQGSGFDYIISSHEVLPTIGRNVSGLRLLRHNTGEVLRAVNGLWVTAGEGSLATIEEILLRMEKQNEKVLEIMENWNNFE